MLGVSKVISAITGLIKATGSAVDKLSTSDEEKGKIRVQLDEIQLKVLTISNKGLMLELTGNALQRSWRPVLMYVFIWIIFWNFFLQPIASSFWIPIPKAEIPNTMWTLITGAMMGYGYLRSREKEQDVRNN